MSLIYSRLNSQLVVMMHLKLWFASCKLLSMFGGIEKHQTLEVAEFVDLTAALREIK